MTEPRFTEEEIKFVAPVLYEVTQKLGIALVHRKELSKAILAKQALRTFLNDAGDDYLEDGEGPLYVRFKQRYEAEKSDRRAAAESMLDM